MKKFLALLFLATPAVASEDIADQYPESPLYAKPVEFIPGVWSAIGATAPPTYENTGHNNNLSFIVTGEGVVVVNGGAAYILAEALHQEIMSITDQPVVLVLNENGQGHAMLGNSYWAEQGVKIVAHDDAAAEPASAAAGAGGAAAELEPGEVAQQLGVQIQFDRGGRGHQLQDPAARWCAGTRRADAPPRRLEPRGCAHQQPQ